MNLHVGLTAAYGPLQAGFAFDIHDGYQVLTGPNNAGKSAILQLAFKTVYRQGGNWPDNIAILLPDRDHVMPTMETGGQQLANYNSQLVQQIDGQPLMYDAPRGPARNQLTALLLGHTDMHGQVDAVNKYLNIVGLPNFLIRRGQQIFIAENVITQQGTGMRSLLTILSALTDTDLALICIDEPELSLEPRLQKALRDLLIEKAVGRTILVATHSHLFLSRHNPPANHRVVRTPDGTVSVQALGTKEDLFNTAFDLLGSDTEDLFFPGNYWVVEGSFDQAICQRGLSLLNVPSTRVKVIAAGGLTKVGRILSAVINSLTPLTLNDSPYARRVVALIDRPQQAEAQQEAELKRILGDRLFVLNVESMEAYVSEAVYQKAGRDKGNELRQVNAISAAGDYKRLSEYKRELSQALAAQMAVEDLDAMPIVRAAAERAANF